MAASPAARPIVRLLLCIAAVLAAAAGTPSAAHAQCTRNPDGTFECPDGQSPGTDAAPVITVHPGAASVAQPAITVTVVMRDEWELVQSTFKVLRTAGGMTQDVTREFGFSKTSYDAGAIRARATATGAIALSPDGPVQVTAYVCDVEQPHPDRCRWSQPAVYRMSLPGVEVTPDAAFADEPAGVARSRAFTVVNRGNEAASFTLRASCRTGAAATSCTTDAASPVALAAGASRVVNVTFPAAQVGSTVSLTLAATQTGTPGVADAGWTEVTVRAASAGPAQTAPGLALVPLNAERVVDRGLCVTAAAGTGAAYECGDLRLAHGLPAHRTVSRAWAPVLLYNSQHAQPRPTVYADVTLPEGARVPVDFTAVLYMPESGRMVSRSFPGSEWAPGTTRRVAVEVDGLAAGMHFYYFQVLAREASSQVSSVVLDGFIPVVDRSASPFGAGWWLAGLESLCTGCVPGGYGIMWTGGDGSARLYRPVPGFSTRWAADMRDGPADTLTLAGSTYTRRLRGGGRVEFNTAGQHLRTVNRLGQATTFEWEATGVLSTLTVPVPAGGGAAPQYLFLKDGTSRITRIHAAGAPAATRIVALDYALGDRRVTSIHDPDGRAVSFVYAEPLRPRAVTSRTDRRGTATHFAYGASGRLVSARLALTGGDSIVTRYDPVEAKGVAQSAGVAQAYTRLDGPRTDVADHTYVWPTRHGPPARVRDATGAETLVEYGDARYPALATRMAGPTGVVSTAVYDGRGRVTSSTVTGAYGGSETSTVSYAWDDACDRPTRTKAPGTDTVFAAYDPVTCNLRWQQQGSHDSRLVQYGYYPAGHPHAGQVDSIVSPLDGGRWRAIERVRYDARGNLLMAISPLGFRTLYRRDALGRDSIVYTPIEESTARDTTLLKAHGARQEILYDGMGRPRETVSHGPALVQPPNNGNGPGTTPAEWLRVVTAYDDGGLPLTVTRTQSPNPAGLQPQVTEYEYDAAGRTTDEWTNGGIHQHFVHDPAGNVVQAVTPRGATIVNRYDAAGRLLRREVPEAFTPQTGGSCPAPMTQFEPTCHLSKFPFYPNFGTGYKTPAEWTTYRYDLAGSMARAENADAVVERTYHPNGQVRTDSTRIRDFEADNAFSRVYGIGYVYDSDGRISRLMHPGNLANLNGIADADSFFYHPQTGALARAADRNGNAFTFNHAPNGQLTSLLMPGGVVDSLRYDLEGRPVWREERSPKHPTVPLQHETFGYDARGKVLRVTVPATVQRSFGSTFVQWYSGLGSLVMTDWVNSDNPQWQRERFTMDPLGNMTARHEYGPGTESFNNDHADFSYVMDANYGRVKQITLVDPEGYTDAMDDTWLRYDLSGNQETSYQRSGPGGGLGFTHLVDTRGFYAADERLRAFQKYDDRPALSQSTTAGVFEEYRYDPLGRRVAVRTRRPPEICNQPTECYNSITFFVWAGDQLLWEVRETDSSDSEHTGGTVSYFQAGGIDRPLTIWKQGVGSVVTHQSWRGQFARGTFGVDPGAARVGASSDCDESPPTNGCLPIRWPGWNTTAWNQEAAKPHTVGSERFWFGSLSGGMRDASGQQYMRNRYYNPQTGQFTQPDPIGLAGGLNSYGFAAGDPVSYSDPYGLCPDEGSSFECPIVLPEVTVVASRYTLMEIDETSILIGGGIFGKGADAARPLLARLGGGLSQLLGRRVATQTARFSGMLRSAAQGKGNFGIGRATAAEANDLGRAWVGEGFTTASNGTTLVSRDGLRQYRPPSYKPRLGREQANLEARPVAEGQWQSNAHIDIVP